MYSEDKYKNMRFTLGVIAVLFVLSTISTLGRRAVFSVVTHLVVSLHIDESSGM